MHMVKTGAFARGQKEAARTAVKSFISGQPLATAG